MNDNQVIQKSDDPLKANSGLAEIMLKSASEWNSVAMPMRYIERSQVASANRRKE